MEVLVSRSDRRTSRVLIIILLFAVSVGIMSFGYKVRRTAPPAQALTPPATQPDSIVQTPAPVDAPIVAVAQVSAPIAIPELSAPTT
jgi:hypothetical protein